MQELILNRYRPISQAGQGGFGTVIVAWDTRMQRKVAIKCIELRDTYINERGETISISQMRQQAQSGDGQPTPDDKDTLTPKTQAIAGRQRKNKRRIDESGEHWEEGIPGLKEARTAAMIQDANIVTVYDFEVQNSTAYIIMEYVEGRTLSQFLSEFSNVLTLDMLTSIAAGISHAIQVAHNENVLHLDIKPDNVLIDNKGKVKVTDFGLATLEDEFGFGKADAGTIGYMPPEQMRQQNLDVRTDQWSLASIIYEMLSGSNPFDAHTLKDSLNKMIDSELVLPTYCWEDLDPQVDEIMFKALSPDKENRYMSIEEFWDELKGYLGNPRAGQRQIANLFKLDNSPEVLMPEKPAKQPMFERMTSSVALSVFGRIFSAVCALLIALLACANIPVLGGAQELGGFQPNVWTLVVVVVCAGAGAFIPVLGVGLAMLAVSIALMVFGNIFVGMALIVVTALWAYFSGIRSMANTNSTLCFPVGGAIGFAQVGPLVCGVFCKPLYAVINALFGFAVCVIFAGFGSGTLIGWEPQTYAIWSGINAGQGYIQESIVNMITAPFVWVWGASWVVSAALVSAMFSLSKRPLRIVGCIAGTVVLLAGVYLAHLVSGTGFGSVQTQGWEILPTCLAGALSVVLAVFLPQRRSEQEVSQEALQ